MEYAAELVGDFISFLHTLPDEEGGYLSDYLDFWMKDGNAIELVAGDHALFLLVALFIADELVNHPEEFGGRAGRIRQFINTEVCGELPASFDRDYWNLFVFRRKYGEQRP